MKQIVWLMVFLMLCFLVLGEEVTRTAPTTVLPGATFDVVYTATNPDSEWFVSYADTISGGCSPTTLENVVSRIPAQSSSLSQTYTFTAPSSGSCTFTGDYVFGDYTKKNMELLTVTVGSSGCPSGQSLCADNTCQTLCPCPSGQVRCSDGICKTSCSTGCECLNPCPPSFRCVNYNPLNSAPSNFVSRITTSGKQCVLKEENVTDYLYVSPLEKMQKYKNECTDYSGAFNDLDGVVIVGGYNSEGQTYGGETYYSDLPFCFKSCGGTDCVGENSQTCTTADSCAGSQSRTCTAGVWSAWSDCAKTDSTCPSTNETVGSACLYGDAEPKGFFEGMFDFKCLRLGHILLIIAGFYLLTRI